MNHPSVKASIPTYWWNQGNNFGDVMNPLLLERLSGLRFRWSNDAQASVFTAAGSIIDDFHTKPGWTIWGGGIISRMSGIPDDLKVLAVRGPKTRQHLLDSGYHSVPEVYGDPGLLLPTAFPYEKCEKVYDLGIIPHYAFRLHPVIHGFSVLKNITSPLSSAKVRRVKVISPKLPVDEFIRLANQCRAIAANSLHGLIVAMAYNIPCVWIHFKNDPFSGRVTSPFVGDTFKYQDFLRSVGNDCEKPLMVGALSDWKTVIAKLDDYRPCQFDPEPLMRAFPFPSDLWEENIEKAKAHYSSFASQV